jgi:hypothetical protein
MTPAGIGPGSGQTELVPADRPCRYCGGAGEVYGVVVDVELYFRCVCSGGSEEAVRWLLGPDVPAPRR